MNVTSVLAKIAKSVQSRLDVRKVRVPQSELYLRCVKARLPHRFAEAFNGPEAHVLAEVKFASPSEGKICDPEILSPVEVASQYLSSGAAALSILTEQDHFGGSLANLSAIRTAHPEARLLLKDFVLEEYQLLEARVHGADAALLIVALIGEDRTAALIKSCATIGLTPLVEVHDLEELEMATRAGAKLIGVNNRNLKTMVVSLDVSRGLAPRIPRGATLISESGLSQGAELKELRALGYAGFLIGTSFMRTGVPGAALAKLLAESR